MKILKFNGSFFKNGSFKDVAILENWGKEDWGSVYQLP